MDLSSEPPPLALGSTSATTRAELFQLVFGAMLAFLVAPLILVGNAFVICPFFRSRRIRTPTNQLLLCLAMSDLLTGLLLPSFVLLQTLRAAIGSRVYSCLLPLSAIIATEAASVLFMLAIAVDKVISLAKPLHYSEIVTKTGFYIFSTFTWTLSAMLGVSHVFVKVESPPPASPSSEATSWECLTSEYPSPSTMTLFYALLLPSGVTVCLCYLYVYIVANRHAKDIKQVEKVVRNKELGDSRLSHMMATYTNTPPPANSLHHPPSSYHGATLHQVHYGSPSPVGRPGGASGMAAAVPSPAHFLVPPPSPASIHLQKGALKSPQHFRDSGTGTASEFASPMHSSTLKNNTSSFCYTTTTNNNNNNMCNGISYGRSSSIGGGYNPGPVSKGRQIRSYKYGMTLMLTVGSFIICRFPAPLYFIIISSSSSSSSLSSSSNSASFLLLFPLFLGSLVNPWLYAYHNLDLKPPMRRLIRQYLTGMGLVRAAERYVTRIEATYISQWQGPPGGGPATAGAAQETALGLRRHQGHLNVPSGMPAGAMSVPAIVEISDDSMNSPPTIHRIAPINQISSSTRRSLRQAFSEVSPKRLRERRTSNSMKVRPVFRAKQVLVESKSAGELVLTSESTSGTSGTSEGSEFKLPATHHRVLLLFSSRVPTVTVWLEGEGEGAKAVASSIVRANEDEEDEEDSDRGTFI